MKSRRNRFFFSIVGALLALAAGAGLRAQQPQRQQLPQPVPNGVIISNGTIYVRVTSASGGPLSSEATVVLTTGQVDGPVTGLPTKMTEDEWEFRNLQVGADYEIRVEAPGYEPQQKFAHLPPFDQTTIRVDFYMQPSGNPDAKPPAGHFLLAPAAQREVQQAIHDLQHNKLDSARKHLDKAIKLAPGNPGVNYLLGLSWFRANRLGDATPYFEKAVSIDPTQLSALLALGTIHYRQGDDPGAIALLTKAVALAPHSWQAQWMLASAYLRAGKNADARTHAELALKHGKKDAIRVNLVLGQALERLGENAKAIDAFEAFLKRDSHDKEATAARAEVARLKQLPPKTAPVIETAVTPAVEPSASSSPAAVGKEPPNPFGAEPRSARTVKAAVGESFDGAEARMLPPTKSKPKSASSLALTPPAPPVNLPPPPNWAPPDVDADRPAIISSAACPLPSLLKRAGRNALALVTNLQEFSATEDYQSVEVSRAVKVGSPVERKFQYMAFIHHIRPQLFTVEELRQPSLHASHMDGQWVGIGSPALALVFHPFFQKYFDWQCEGLGEWKGQPAWLVHFAQNPSQPISPLHVFTIGPEEYQVALKGLAWVGEKNGEVVHLETDIMKPMERIELAREHFAIDYRLVRFRTHPVSLWLPEDVNLYIAYRHHYYHSYSHFSDFQLFWVGAGQKVSSPKQDKKNR